MITKVKVAENDVNQYIRYFFILMLDNKQKSHFDDCAHMAHCFRFVRLCVRACEGAGADAFADVDFELNIYIKTTSRATSTHWIHVEYSITRLSSNEIYH